MSIVHIQGIGDHHATAYESGNGRSYGIQLRDYQQALVDEVKQKIDGCDKVIALCASDFSASHIHSLMAEPIVAGGGPLIIKPCHEFAGILTATMTAEPMIDPMTDADRDRAIWNEAVDQRNAERKQRRRVEAMRSRISKLVPAWMNVGVSSTPTIGTGEELTPLSGPTIAELQARGDL